MGPKQLTYYCSWLPTGTDFTQKQGILERAQYHACNTDFKEGTSVPSCLWCISSQGKRLSLEPRVDRSALGWTGGKGGVSVFQIYLNLCLNPLTEHHPLSPLFLITGNSRGKTEIRSHPDTYLIPSKGCKDAGGKHFLSSLKEEGS